ncbi:MAG: hypothetical protein AAGC83_14460, partial [Pseudomonadota bacterium]
VHFRRETHRELRAANTAGKGNHGLLVFVQISQSTLEAAFRNNPVSAPLRKHAQSAALINVLAAIPFDLLVKW